LSFVLVVRGSGAGQPIKRSPDVGKTWSCDHRHGRTVSSHGVRLASHFPALKAKYRTVHYESASQVVLHQCLRLFPESTPRTVSSWVYMERSTMYRHETLAWSLYFEHTASSMVCGNGVFLQGNRTITSLCVA
jgi:hypothetical protein